MLIFCNPYFHERIADRCLIWEELENLSAYQKLDWPTFALLVVRIILKILKISIDLIFNIGRDRRTNTCAGKLLIFNGKSHAYAMFR